MSELTWKDLRDKRIVIHTPTEDLMKLVINTIVENEKIGDIKYGEYGHDFSLHKEDTCIRIDKLGIWSYSDIEFYVNNKYKIVEYEEVKHLFEDYIDTIEIEEVEYLAKVKLKNGEEGYFREEWGQGEHWLSPVEEIKYADTYTNLTTLKEILNLYKEEIKEYKIIKQTTVSTSTFAFIE